MAYDLFLRKWTPRNFALTSMDVSTRTATVATDDEKAYLAKLAVVKMNADAGNKKAKKTWKKARADLGRVSSMAKKGDPKAKHLLAVVQESGLFSGVKAMDVSGAEEVSLSPKARSLLLLLGKVKSKATQGDPRALGLISAINTLHLERVPGAGMAGDAELIEELKTRAQAGDERSQKRLEEIQRRGSKTSGEELTPEQAARKMLEDAADAKSISRGNLKKAIYLFAGPNATDKERVAVGSKVLAFLSKKNVQITS